LAEGDQQISEKKKSYFTSKNGKDWDLAMLVDLIVDRRIKKIAKENSSGYETDSSTKDDDMTTGAFFRATKLDDRGVSVVFDQARDEHDFSLLRKLRKHAQMMRTMSWNFMIYLRYTLEVLIHPVISRLVTSFMLPILSRKTSNLIITCLRMHAQP